MTRIVRIAYRYKRPPPRKRKAAALDVPAVVKAAKVQRFHDVTSAPQPEPAAEARESAVVAIRSRKHAMLAHLLEDLTPEEHRRRKVVTHNESHAARWRERRLADILGQMRHDGCGGRAAKAELLTGVEGVSSRPVRRIVLREG